ncbi:hypothetical protein HMN09_00146700 [Mycena chlorophos]|uniref:Uncharacterized protein n=1 Tax=Mycena chlorophos TaxID=658473 RepID=A0A8H6TPW4_MYCCL|nr:hypothetical protein HMN09_00146700 [Mycena chlorophos]
MTPSSAFTNITNNPGPPPRARPNPSDAALVQATVQRLEALAVASSTATKKKGKGSHSSGDTSASGHQTLHNSGRRLIFSLSPFLDYFTVVDSFVRHELNPAEPNEDADEQKARAYEQEVMKEIERFVPGFSIDMINTGGFIKVRQAVCQQLQSGTRGARSDDSDSLNKALMAMLNRFYGPRPLPGIEHDPTSAIPTTSDLISIAKKSNRGLSHRLTARLICPVKYADTEETVDQLIERKLDMDHTLFFRGMYAPGTRYDPNNPEVGLLDHPVMYSARLITKHICNGPSTVDKDPGAVGRRVGKGGLAGLTSLGPSGIAYLVTQYRFILASHTWTEKAGNFDYRIFYTNVKDLLADKASAAIIAKFNYHVFGAGHSLGKRVAPAPADSDTGPSDFDLLKAARAAKRARVEPDADAPSEPDYGQPMDNGQMGSRQMVGTTSLNEQSFPGINFGNANQNYVVYNAGGWLWD